MEPHRAPAVQLHHDQLAWQAAVLAEDDHQPDRFDNRTSTGLEVYARLDDGTYPDKIKVTNAEFKTINIAGREFHPEWNYIIRPHGH